MCVPSVIEVDGTAHQPQPIDSLDILAGQRYSLVMAADQPVDNYVRLPIF